MEIHKKSGPSRANAGFTSDAYNPTQDTELSQNSRDELNQIEYHISEMAASKKSAGTSSSDFLEIFERYKTAMSKEMMSMRKNLTFVLQENNHLKSQILESNKKEGHYQQLENQYQQLKKETAEYANSVNAKQSNFQIFWPARGGGIHQHARWEPNAQIPEASFELRPLGDNQKTQKKEEQSRKRSWNAFTWRSLERFGGIRFSGAQMEI